MSEQRMEVGNVRPVTGRKDIVEDVPAFAGGNVQLGCLPATTRTDAPVPCGFSVSAHPVRI